MSSVFLSAEWRKLAIANYEVDPKFLLSYLPYKTELDFWNGACYVSLVGFMFLDTKLKGIRIPFHANFEEVNLRFYVRYYDSETKEWKRGVVFIKEIVPKPALAFIANIIYKENYQTMQMNHSWTERQDELLVEYAWKLKRWNTFKVIAASRAVNIVEGSEEEFITEHYWGYTKIAGDKSSEYQVEHPQWNVYAVKETVIDVDFGNVYGEKFNWLNNQRPKSVFLAEGSQIKVRSGSIIGESQNKDK
jgi:uncharacterized protein YqjF (DUF2071 family)